MTTIVAYADVWCPFAHVGLSTLARRRNELGGSRIALRIHAWPLELVNGVPLDPKTTAKHVKELKGEVAPELFAGFDPARFPKTSLPALATAARAYRDSDITGELVSLELRHALFEEGLDISRTEVLSAIVRRHGLDGVAYEDEASVMDDWRRGQALGVKGSPHFFCGNRDVFCPLLDITKGHTGHLSVRQDLDALDSFLSECIAG